ncbi:hypothetical protein [Glycomyces harbinensis]|uniref:Uncharacterized protein n=1 Tax=Glycomyces harbinensis TaxID=58114 RepID=A0A1G6TV85_9ACTN|nr:hypothetical protein [Glycomyces harbinensis]SDD32376.1 hypothetical protein SAMN05216270_103144 [Glycomyces harbinensis]
MAHGPSPFGVPQQQSQGPGNRPEPGYDWSEYDDRAQMGAPTVRLGPDELPPAAFASEEEMEAHLEHIHASRPLRRAVQRARRRTRWWLVALAVVSGLAVAAACTAGAFIVLREGEPEASPSAAASDPGQASTADEATDAPEVVDPIASRETDAEPISIEELFGAGTITPAGAAGAYEVLDTEELTDCAAAALDELAELLADVDCTQTVRATLVNPDGEYVATAGVLNLNDAAAAAELSAAITEGLKGGFAVLRSDGGAEELGRGDTQLGYNTYGHYLMYVVIGYRDGEALEEANDPVRTIVGDIVDVWFVDQLKPRRDIQ